MITPNKSYIGIIWDGEDISQQLLYPVYIRSLSPVGNLNIFWVRNELNNGAFTRWMDPSLHATNKSGRKSAGSYRPLHYGLPVEIRFRTEQQDSGYIYKIINNNGYSPVEHKKKDSFYLLEKTVGDSYIYLDDEKETIHIMNSKGKSNLFMDPTRVTLEVGDLINDGVQGINSSAIIEASKSGIFLKMNNNYIRVDETGITFSVGDKSRTYLQLTETGIKLGSADNIQIRSEKDLSMEGSHTFVQGDTELDIYSANTKVSGAQLLNITGNVVSMDSTTQTFIKGNHVKIEGLLKTSISGLMVDVKAYSQLYLNSLVQVTSSQVISNSAPTIANAGTIIMNDGMIMNNMNMATGIATSLSATALATSIGTDAAAMGITTALTSSNDPVTGLAATMMTAILPGSAIMANNMNIMPVLVAPELVGCSQAITFINAYNTAGNDHILSPLPLPITI